MRESHQWQQSIDLVDDLRIGESFRDHGGQVIERVSGNLLLIGPGYNREVTDAEYAGMAADGVTYGPHLIPAGENAGWLEMGRRFAFA